MKNSIRYQDNNNELQLQETFFEKLKQQISSGTLIANEIANVLDLSISEAYNKLSGKSQLTVSQMELLCKKYDLNFLVSCKKVSPPSLVEYYPFYQQEITIENYLFSLKKFLEETHTAQNKKLQCASEDIPIFHLFKYPELSAFKIYYWQRRLQAKNGTSLPVFDMNMISEEVINTTYDLHSLYCNIPGVEIWSRGALFNTTDQIKYAAETGIIKDKALAKKISQQFYSTLSDVENYAIQKSKDNNTNIPFEWYFCETIGNITYLAQIEKKDVAFVRLNTFNNLRTEDETLCKEIKLWMDALIYDGVSFSGNGSKYRNIYLDEAYKICNGLITLFD